MGPFKRHKENKQNLAAAMGEFRRAQDTAKQGMEKFEGDVGMDLHSMYVHSKAAMRGGGMERLTAYRDRAARVTGRGVEMPATLRSVKLGEPNPMLGGIPADLQLTVEPPGRAPYEVSTDQPLHESIAATLAAGQRVTVKVDPDDPQCLLLWGAGDAPAAAAAPPDNRIARVAKLQELRASGVLSEEEFQFQKAKLLAG